MTEPAELKNSRPDIHRPTAKHQYGGTPAEQEARQRGRLALKDACSEPLEPHWPVLSDKETP
jgi:hypothetical protein